MGFPSERAAADLGPSGLNVFSGAQLMNWISLSFAFSGFVKCQMLLNKSWSYVSPCKRVHAYMLLFVVVVAFPAELTWGQLCVYYDIYAVVH